MRKRVTFVEQLKKETRSKNGHVLTRSAEYSQRGTGGVEYLPGEPVREAFRGKHGNVSSGGQPMKTIHVPKSMMAAPFLQHPALTAGQRRYLCSIASVYSTEHMRQQMKQHYLHLLHTCLQSGQNPPCSRRLGTHQRGENKTKDAVKDVRMKPQGPRKSSNNSDVILPKIINR
ncbi:hypothetical protein CesoFtcFv8_004260 [Champsocephalus esox]|uniref:Protein FAM216A n=1 Tax=Champsocephalus esox TaxID=159716 RepID=A0AAN8CYA7_9TELE|nr:hypothetical protein CesoFtcFv8_004260 [Champsocephalus esox]